MKDFNSLFNEKYYLTALPKESRSKINACDPEDEGLDLLAKEVKLVSSDAVKAYAADRRDFSLSLEASRAYAKKKEVLEAVSARKEGKKVIGGWEFVKLVFTRK